MAARRFRSWHVEKFLAKVGGKSGGVGRRYKVTGPPKHGISIFQQAIKIFNYPLLEGFRELMTVANFNDTP